MLRSLIENVGAVAFLAALATGLALTIMTVQIIENRRAAINAPNPPALVSADRH